MEQTRFEQALAAATAHESESRGIGTLGERTLHAVAKFYTEPDPEKHEQKIGSHVVDVFSDGRIYEIQTGQFGRLIPKLEALLPDYPVTIVYPIQAKKWLVWIDPETGEASTPRLSPRRGSPIDVFYELYRIKPWLSHPGLSVTVLMFDLKEQRLLNGWSHDRKRGSHRKDRMPEAISEEISVAHKDYGILLPDSLPAEFTSADLAKAAGVSRRTAQISLNVLVHLGCAEVCGKSGRSRLHRVTSE